MKLGIVGHEAAKFTPEMEAEARQAIRDAIQKHQARIVISGGCHLGGVDIWAMEEARRLGLVRITHRARVHQWSAHGGYRERNIGIAEDR